MVPLPSYTLLQPTTKRLAMQLFGYYEGVIGYYSCCHHSPLPSPSPFPSLQGNLANIEISPMPKHRLAHFSKWLRLEKLVELPPSLDNISLTHPQHKDPKWTHESSFASW